MSPAISITSPAPVSGRPGRDELKRAENEVLRRERLLRNKGEVTSSVYRYSMSADGKPYITGATVTIRTSLEKETGTAEEPPGEVTEGSRTAVKLQKEAAENPSSEREATVAAAKLKAMERDVIAHEAAHKAAGGQYAGPITYIYITGPDGSRYIAGGEVSISAPEGKTPEETVQIMEQVKRAALAPASPSPQDLRVAAAASAAQMRARAEIARQGALNAYSGNGKEQGFREEPGSFVA